jgi:hypothetical protein
MWSREMTTSLSFYLNSIRDNLRLEPSSEKEVIDELQTHIDDKLRELKESGLSEEEAANTCVSLLGSAKLVACQLYEAHSQGTWRQTLLASMPHFLFASLFVLNWWRGSGWLLIILVSVLTMAVYGWWHGKPTWLFSWLGYSLLPVVAAGLSLLYLPKGWSWLAILLYIPLALWLLYSITLQTIKRDWLYCSLMLLPVPTIIAWFLVVEPMGRYPEYWLERIQNFAPWIGLSFLALAVAVALFIRLRQRWLKVSVLVISGLLTLIMVACYAEGKLGLFALLVLIVVMLGLVLIPALLEHWLKHGRQQPIV